MLQINSMIATTAVRNDIRYTLKAEIEAASMGENSSTCKRFSLLTLWNSNQPFQILVRSVDDDWKCRNDLRRHEPVGRIFGDAKPQVLDDDWLDAVAEELIGNNRHRGICDKDKKAGDDHDSLEPALEGHVSLNRGKDGDKVEGVHHGPESAEESVQRRGGVMRSEVVPSPQSHRHVPSSLSQRQVSNPRTLELLPAQVAIDTAHTTHPTLRSQVKLHFQVYCTIQRVDKRLILKKWWQHLVKYGNPGMLFSKFEEEIQDSEIIIFSDA